MVEIERKFLIKPNSWKPGCDGTRIIQGYLSIDPERVVRVRVAGEKSFITIKGKPAGIVRTELEYEIPTSEATILLKMCLPSPVEKIRYKEKHGNHTWEIDVFEGENKGLVMAEVELAHENEVVDFPGWVGEEVSYDKRYFNSYLAQNPFSGW